MRFRTRVLYLIWAIIRSYVEIIAAIVLFTAAYIWTLSLSESALRGQGPTILLGVVSSVIATLLISISGKYSASCRAHTNIVHCAIEMSRWVRRYKNYFCSDQKEITKHGFYLNQYYMNMCSEACQLTYGGDFSNFSKSIAFFMQDLNDDLTADEFEKLVGSFDATISFYDCGRIEGYDE